MDFFVGVGAVGLLVYICVRVAHAQRIEPSDPPRHGPLDEHDYQPMLRWVDEEETLLGIVLVCDCGREL